MVSLGGVPWNPPLCTNGSAGYLMPEMHLSVKTGPAGVSILIKVFGAGIFPGVGGGQIYWVSCLFSFYMKKGFLQFLTVRLGDTCNDHGAYK